ncbi:MAG: efflux RND transporter permease subunit [Anaerolineales bacterium]|nr:efflux RND transporter permease subunit [Anaerolineales bacterium]
MLERAIDALTHLSIRAKWITLLLSALFMAAGAVGLTQLNQELLPKIDFPQSVIITQGSNFDAGQMRDAVTIPLEEAIGDVEGVVNLESTTSSGLSVIIARNEFGRDQAALRDAVAEAAQAVDLPADVDAPELLNFSLSDLPVMVVSASSPDLSLEELKALIEEEISPELLDVSQVASVDVTGGQELPEEMLASAADRAAQSAVDATPTPEPVALPERWIQAADALDQPIANSADLTPDLVEAALERAPELLDELTPEIVAATPIEALQAVPASLYNTLSPEVVAAFEQRLGAEEVAQAQATAAAAPTATPTPAATATAEATATVTVANEEGGAVALPESWIAAGTQQGLELATTDDLTAELVGGIASFAPELLDDLTPEMLLAMPAEALAALPPDYLATLDADTQAALQARVAEGDTTLAAPVALPERWLTAAEAQGLTIATTADLTPFIVGGLAAEEPSLVDELTAEMLLAMPTEALAALPSTIFTSLDDETVATLSARLSEAGYDVPDSVVTLPLAWQQGGEAQGITLRTPADVTPEIMQGISGAAPQLLDELTPQQLALLPAETLAWLPTDFVDGLDEALRTELESLAAEAGGLGSAYEAQQAAAEALSADAPPLEGMWALPPEDDPTADPRYQTAADLINNGFTPTAASFLNALIGGSGPPNGPQMVADISPEAFQWLIANEAGFLEGLEPATLRLVSPDALSTLPDEFLQSLSPELRDELEGLASGARTAFVPTDSISRINGAQALTLSIFKESDANTVSVSHDVDDKLRELEAQYDGLTFETAFEQASFIEESISGVAREGALGAVFAVIIILIFLSGRVRGKYQLSWRSTLVTAVSIPLSIFMAFMLMRWMPSIAHPIIDPLVKATANVPFLGPLMVGVGRLFPENITLNIMTLSGITVAIGRVVDDSIVVLENIYRHIQRGDEQLEAVTVGTRDVALAIFASTITTVVVFLPIGLIGGLIGEFFLPFGIAVTYALLSSFLVAVTTVPVLAFLFIRKEHLPPEEETALQRGYTPILEWALTHRWQTLLIAALLFGGSLWLLAQRPQAFVPDLGEVQISAAINLPGDVTMGDTLLAIEQFEEALQEMEGLGTIRSEVGTGGAESRAFSGGIDQSLAAVQVAVEEPERQRELTDEVRRAAEATFGADAVTVTAGTLSSQGFGGFALVLSGEPDRLLDVNTQVIDALNAVDGLANVSSNLADADTILRVDGESAVRFTGELETDDALGVTAEAKEVVQGIVPSDIAVSEGFESEQQTQGFAQAALALLVSVVVVYLVMVLTFRSLLSPFAILFSLPMALIGAAVAMWLTDRVLGMSAMVGLMMLVGIVVTNAIVFIDRVQNNRKLRGMSVYEALVEAGRIRLRPILMTAITAILALVPLALGFSEGAIIAAELATVVIGGLFSSTVLTLVVVPVMYSLLQRARRQQPAAA